jgi:transcriptional regulator with XRE-family HTH domain
MNNLKLIGPKIKEIRKKQGISQEKLAEMTAVHHQTIIRIENSHTIPTIETLNKIATALKVNINDFFETQHLQSREEIIANINKTLEEMSDDDLKSFYKAIYHFCT